jgi:dienelactone hydrolase
MGQVVARRLTRRQVLRAAGGALLPVSLLGGSLGGEAVLVPPAALFPVERRQFAFSRGPDRPLRTVVWSPVAPGPFPLVLFSHGLHGSPERFAQMIADIAGAGFVVAAPAYPNTMAGTAAFDAGDMPNQPADAAAVITAVLAGELAGRVLPDRIGAVGHSAGGYTTAGLLAGRSRDTRVRTAVVLAGGAMNGAFTGPATEVLFVQGDRDPIVPYAAGRAAYQDVPWPKAFLTLAGADHESWMFDRSRAAVVTTRTVLGFLRAFLHADPSARTRLDTDGALPGVARLEAECLQRGCAPEPF